MDRRFQGCRTAPAPTEHLPGPVGWEEVAEWERSASGRGTVRDDTNANANSNFNTDSVRCTPWRCRDELLAVRDLLYAPDEEGTAGQEARATKRRLGISTVTLPLPSPLVRIVCRGGPNG
jgi:hypothetical protein